MGALYTTMIKKRKDEVAAWAQNWYPDTWARVEERLKALPGKQVDVVYRDFEEGVREVEERWRQVEADLANLPAGEREGEGEGDEEKVGREEEEEEK